MCSADVILSLLSAYPDAVKIPMVMDSYLFRWPLN
jgi:hypothetical protein